MVKSKAKKPRKKLVRYYPIREIYTVGASSMVYGSLDARKQREILEQIRQQAYEGLERQIRLATSRLTER